MNCFNCNKPLPPFKKEKERRANFVGVGWVAVRNVWLVQCKNKKCRSINFDLDVDSYESFKMAIARELANMPLSLKGSQFKWLKNFVIKRFERDKKLARWLGFKNLDFYQGECGLSFSDAFLKDGSWESSEKAFQAKVFFKEFLYCLAKKIGVGSVEEIAELEKLEKLPERIDDKVKELIRHLDDDNVFMSEIKFLDNQYVILIDFNQGDREIAPASNQDGKSMEQEKLEVADENRGADKVSSSVAEQAVDQEKLLARVKSLLYEAGIIVSHEEIICRIKQENTDILCRYESGQIMAVGLLFANSEENALYVNYCAVDKSAPDKERIMIEFIRGIITNALAKSIGVVIVAKPPQVEIRTAFISCGFQDVGACYALILR